MITNLVFIPQVCKLPLYQGQTIACNTWRQLWQGVCRGSIRKKPSPALFRSLSSVVFWKNASFYIHPVCIADSLQLCQSLQIWALWSVWTISPQTLADTAKVSGDDHRHDKQDLSILFSLRRPVNCFTAYFFASAGLEWSCLHVLDLFGCLLSLPIMQCTSHLRPYIIIVTWACISFLAWTWWRTRVAAALIDGSCLNPGPLCFALQNHAGKAFDETYDK